VQFLEAALLAFKAKIIVFKKKSYGAAILERWLLKQKDAFLHIENENLILGFYEEVYFSTFFKKLFAE
jgi:hypothetical protein